MPTALYFTDDPEACKLLADDPFALLVGLRDRPAGDRAEGIRRPVRAEAARRDARAEEARRDGPRPAFAEKPAIHRFPGAMADRVRELAAVVTEEYGGDASRIWSEATRQRRSEEADRLAPGVRRDEDQVARRGAREAVRRRRRPRRSRRTTRRSATSPRPSRSPSYQAAKRAYKAKVRAGDTKAGWSS